MKPASFKKYFIALILFFALVKIIASYFLELGNDESYYWLYTQQLQWNYFDHPPMVALWGRIFSFNLLLQNKIIFLRLGSVLASALAAFCIYKTVALIKDSRAGWFAACLYSSSFYAGITAGIFLMPDAPQMLFYTFALWMLTAILKDETKWKYWLLFGAAAGFCIMSKIHGVFLWTGFGLYVLFKNRSWLINPKLYAAVLITFIIASPILIWNIRYDFMTYRFHSERVVLAGHHSNWYNLFEAFAGQLVINNPINVILSIAGLFLLARKKQVHPPLVLFNFIAIPFILLILFMAFFRTTLPHWSGPAFVALIPIAAVWLAGVKSNIIFPAAIKMSIGIYLAGLTACLLLVNFYPANMGSRAQKNLGQGDITLDSYGWKKAGEEFKNIYTKEVSNGTVKKGTPLVCNNWWGAHEEYYFCRPLSIKMIGLGSINEIHHYAWLNGVRSTLCNMANAYCIIHSDENYDAKEVYKNYYSSIDTVAIIPVLRSQKPAHNFYVLRLSDWKNNVLTIAK